VVGISVDADTTLLAWTGEKNYPAAYASDKDLTILKLYGSLRGSAAARNLFVIGPDGRITYRVMGFNVLSQDAYAELEKAVDAAAGVSSPP
jgi:peroxiredoxin